MNLKVILEKLREKDLRKKLVQKLKTASYYVAGIFAVAAILVVVDLHSDGRTYPQSWVGPLHVGYLQQDEAKAKLEKNIDQYLKTPLTFSLQEKTVEATPSELGIEFNSNYITTLPLFQFTRSFPGKSLSFLWEKHAVPLRFFIDGDKATRVLEAKFELTAGRARNAAIMLDKKKISLAAEQNGFMLDRKNLLKNLEEKAGKLESGLLEVQLVEEKPSIAAAAITTKLDQISAQIKQPIRLWYGGKKWRIDPDAHLDALSFEEEQFVEFKNIPLPSAENCTTCAPAYLTLPIVIAPEKLSEEPSDNFVIRKNTRLAFDPTVLTPFLEEKIIGSINRPPSDVKMYQDDQKKVIIEGKGLNGLTVPPVKLVNSLTLAMNNGAGHVQIPVYETLARYDISKELQAMGVRELISVGHSSFHGSPPNRVYNIKFGIQKYNGILLQPGETFSFNKYIGQVDGRSGFLPEKVIKQNKIEYEYGGGICQVSTTAYRAALLGGLKINYRAPHSIKVAYYAQVLGHGLDATIYPGTHDLKFTNDTPGAIVMQAYEDNGNAYFKFYGTNDGRTVKLEGPYGGGLNYQWFRHLIKDGQETKEAIVSNYKVLAPPTPPPASPPPVAGATTAGSPATT